MKQRLHNRSVHRIADKRPAVNPSVRWCRKEPDVISDATIEQESRYNEDIVEKRFKSLRLVPERLDRQGPRSRPEFLVSDSSGPLLTCEVKTIFSGGFFADRNAHASTEDPALLNTGVFSTGIDFGRIRDNLRDAERKYRCLIEDRPSLQALPLLVVFFFDPFADFFDLYPSRMEEFPEVSGIARVISDHAIRQVAEKMSLNEIKARIEAGSMRGLPASSKEFLLVQNECAINPLPDYFVEMCIRCD